MEYSFGNWVKRRRKALDLTQHELAQRLGCSDSLIFKIESDERRPSRQIAELLAQTLEIPPDQRAQFLKVARQEKAVDALDGLPLLPSPRPAPVPQTGNLPPAPTLLVGREHEIAILTRQLLEPTCRMLTLTGPGGVGKTRLALEAGKQLEAHFTDGVFFLSLAGANLTESVLPALADALGLSFSGPAEPLLQLANFLQAKNILLVVDNMEHLLEGRHLLGEILQKTRRVKMLVTSREPLRLQWEWLFEVQGLPVPEQLTADLETNSALRLFIQRARQTSQKFSLETEDSTAIVRICKLVGGLPLAIELAASWVRVLSCHEIALELERSLDLLETRSLDVPLRHRSIRSVFDHSWTLLTDEERRLLMQLSIFQGGFTRSAALSVTGASLMLLSSLVDKSLVRHTANPDRYDLHELIRQYTFANLQADPAEATRAFERYAQYFSDWIASLEAPFKSAQQAQTSQQIRAETGNWLAAWNWAVQNQRLDLLRRMIPCLNWYLEVHGYYAEALSAFRSAVEMCRARGAPESLERAEEKSAFAFLIDSLGWFEFRTGNIPPAVAHLSESLEIAQTTGDTEVLYYIYGNWGYLCLLTGEIPEAQRLTSESLVQAQALDSAWHNAIPISVLGIVAYQQGNLTESRRQLTESLSLWRTVGDPRGLVFCLLYLGMTTLALEEISATHSILQESNMLAEANQDRWAHAFGLDMLGMVLQAQGQSEAALEYFDKSLELFQEIGDSLNGAQSALHKGRAYVALQRYPQARQIFKEMYAAALQAQWTLIILNALVAFAEIPDELSEETKLAVALSVLAHASATPNMRARCERLRNEQIETLTAEQIKTCENLARQKTPEIWAQEILQ